MAQKTHLAITACAGGWGCGDSILEDEIGDDDFREVSGDKTDPDWSMIKRTFEAVIHGKYQQNLDSYMPRGAMALTRKWCERRQDFVVSRTTTRPHRNFPNHIR